MIDAASLSLPQLFCAAIATRCSPVELSRLSVTQTTIVENMPRQWQAGSTTPPQKEPGNEARVVPHSVVVTPRRACAKQGLCDRLCPFIYQRLDDTFFESSDLIGQLEGHKSLIARRSGRRAISHLLARRQGKINILRVTTLYPLSEESRGQCSKK